jgi:raffinose/stachyose/melibiose transport system permease protein
MRKNQALGKSGRSALTYMVIVLAALATTGPLLWIIGVSFKTEREFAAHPFGLPTRFDLAGYIQILTDESMLRFIFNSAITTTCSIVIVVSASVLAGYALARTHFRGSRLLYIVFILSDAIPVFVVLVPLFILIQRMGLGGTRWSLILPYSAMKVGISVFIMRGFFRSISSDMEDAARIDGCNLPKMLWFVMLPLIRPGAIVVAILNFISFWNEYFLAAVLLPTQDLFTLPAGLASIFLGRYDANWPMMASGIVISAVPTLAIFAFAQDKLIESWTVTIK